MSEVLDAVWEQIEPTVYITREEWERGLNGWSVETVDDADGALAFAVFTRGPEFHFISFGRQVPISMKMIRDRVQPLIARHGCAQTRTPKDDLRQRRFNELIGFKQGGEDEFYVHYYCTHFGANRQCQ